MGSNGRTRRRQRHDPSRVDIAGARRWRVRARSSVWPVLRLRWLELLHRSQVHIEAPRPTTHCLRETTGRRSGRSSIWCAG